MVKWDIAKLQIASDEKINDVNKKNIQDISSYEINTELTPHDRLKNYLLSCENPYITRHNDVLIKVEYQNKKTLSDILVEILSRYQD